MAAANTSGAAGKQNRGRMLISCPDRPGIVAAVSKFLSDYGANIVQSDQYTMDPEGGMFFIRIEFDLTDLEQRKPRLEADFAGVAAEFSMDWSLSLASQRKRLAIFVSKEDHCLLELLWHWRAGDLDADIAMVVSNHPDMAPLVEPFGIPYHHIPVTPDTKAEVEKRHLELLEGQVDLIILARYMQIIPPSFIKHYQNRIINIHHSFLPAFVGGKPYAQAHGRGVKLIGATAHYVTEELDGGPIIEQDVQRVSHRDNVDDLKRIGRHIERIVLARAVSWHTEDRILVHQNKTVVFS
ncbi:formyltetrahydrofolate deformylase [Paenibacillus chitinolyticus]|uniref:Formyltetrahydrofolate deformylase n=1 Tax=Paenibacillus chitinolyticus TaxID=79263 RepID=A0A410WS93_9BACL|nr:formyltetrahydrofolate deformylase [Paenibacillus chitinolyticus]MCY9588937.1 formyltetrahydrofolate deformylase [Paenibacillus chitinolyticus]MCY9595391.1 formyltetrahydrofolate deformylase [Paenibacillus chitinolyticus]QAV17167.1 formyltetrahydrofolate deformylase [Paenibacillus chitinolyticus]